MPLRQRNLPAASVQLYRADTTGVRYYVELFGANHFAQPARRLRTGQTYLGSPCPV